MGRTHVYPDQRFDIYELYEKAKHEVDATDASNNYIVIDSIEPHAVVIADEEYARGYVDGVRSTITNVEYDTVADPLDTTVHFSSLTAGQIVDIYFPVTGTGSGSLESNTDTGKLSLPRLQSVRNWNVAANKIKVPECGSERKRRVKLSKAGTIVLGLNRFGNTAMADFIAAREGKSTGDKIWLLIDEVDTAVSPHTHVIMHESRVRSYRRVSNAADSARGIITDTITFSFVPRVELLTET